MEGWIKLHRKLIEWEWYSDQNAKSLFIHCLLKANIKDKMWRGVNIKKGQFFTSFGNLAFDLDLTVKQIRIAVSKLESTGDIIHEGASNGTKITICNYATYQSNTKQKGQAEGQTEGKPGASQGQQLKKEEKVNKEDKEYIPAFEEFSEYAILNKPDVDKTNLQLKYKAWFEAGWKDGNGKAIKNWKSKLLNTLPHIKQDGKSTGSLKRVDGYWPDR